MEDYIVARAKMKDTSFEPRRVCVDGNLIMIERFDMAGLLAELGIA